MRTLFFGIYGVGTDALNGLLGEGIDVVAVASKPSGPDHRQPVVELAMDRGLPCLQPAGPGETGFVDRVRDLAPDLIVVAGYHRLLPEKVLGIPPRGAVNLHLSLLPAYRGPCPWKWAIANGERRTGVTVHRVGARIDAGDILAQQEVGIDEAATGESLFADLSRLGSRLLAGTVARIGSGSVEGRRQDEARASYFGPPTDRDTRIRWDRSAERILNQVRGFSPRPGAWTRLDGIRVIVGGAAPAPAGDPAPPGTILAVGPDSVRVATATVPLDLTRLTAARVRVGDVFELPRD